jgi:AcrR family transcriptional regulator
VVANQRERLLSAISSLLAEREYAALTVTVITPRARVSRATFYNFFRDKSDAVRAAQQRALGMLDRALAGSCASRAGWSERVALGVRAALEFCRQNPVEARILLSLGAVQLEPGLVPQGGTLRAHLVRMLADGAGNAAGVHEPDPVRAEAAIGAAVSIVDSWFADGGAGGRRRDDLAEGLTEIVLAPYLDGDGSAASQPRPATSWV